MNLFGAVGNWFRVLWKRAGNDRLNIGLWAILLIQYVTRMERQIRLNHAIYK